MDDAPDTLELVQRILARRGHRVLTAARASDALAVLETSPVDLLITDIRMPERDGLALIREVRARRPELEIVVITGYATIEGAVEALRVGAWDYLPKPFTDSELIGAVERVLGRRTGAAAPAARERLAEFHGLLGEAMVTRQLFAELEAAAAGSEAVLLRGEPGSGCEAAARALHAASGRSGRFVRVSLGVRAGVGRAAVLGDERREAAGGTLYLASLELASGEIVKELAAAIPAPRAGVRAGDEARLVASTALAPERLAARGSAWSALLPRFGRTIVVPPLRERGGDAVRLATRFLAELAADAGTPVRVLSEPAELALRAYGWPGNVGELRALATSLASSGQVGAVSLGELPAHVVAASAADPGGDLSLLAAERRHVAEVIRRTGGNKSRAAELLGIDRKTLREKLRQMGAPDEEREE